METTPTPRRWLDWILYAALTVVLTFPLTFRLGSSSLLGDGDAWLFVWNMWRMAFAWQQGLALFCTDAVSFPAADCSYLHTWAYPLTALSVPLQALLSPIALYNLFAWAGFPLAAAGMNRLARHLGADPWGAFLSGLAFGFSPYHFAHALGHLNLMFYGWIPFALLAFLRGRRDGWTVGRVAILAGWLVLIALTDWYYFIFAAAALVFLCFSSDGLRVFASSRAGLLAAVAAIAAALLILSPLLVPMIEQSSRVPEVDAAGMPSADVQSFFLPGEVSTYADLFQPWNTSWRAGAGEAGTFLPWTLLAIALLGWWKGGEKWVVGSRRRAAGNGNPEPGTRWFWSLWVVAFGLLSLGSALQVGGEVTGMPLPYRLIQEIPLLDIMRAPIRFHVLTLIGLCVLYAWGARFLVRRFGSAAGVAAGVLLALETLSIPLPMSKPDVSPFYQRLARESDGALLDLHYPAKAAFYQTVHHRPFLSDGSVFSRASTDSLAALGREPIRRIVAENRLLSFGNGWPGEGGVDGLPIPDRPYQVTLRAKLRRNGRLLIETPGWHELWVGERLLEAPEGRSETRVTAAEVPVEIRLRSRGEAGRDARSQVRVWLDGEEVAASSDSRAAFEPANPIYGQSQEGFNWYVYPVLSVTEGDSQGESPRAGGDTETGGSAQAAEAVRTLREMGFAWIVIPTYANESSVRDVLGLTPSYQDHLLRAYSLVD